MRASAQGQDALTIAHRLPIVQRIVRTPRQKGAVMLVWNKKIALGLLAAFAVMIAVFSLEEPGTAASHLGSHTTFWITLNYVGLVVWVFIWMLAQANVRGQQAAVWVWLMPFLFAPLPTLAAYILFMQRKA